MQHLETFLGITNVGGSYGHWYLVSRITDAAKYPTGQPPTRNDSAPNVQS